MGAYSCECIQTYRNNVFADNVIYGIQPYEKEVNFGVDVVLIVH